MERRLDRSQPEIHNSKMPCCNVPIFVGYELVRVVKDFHIHHGIGSATRRGRGIAKDTIIVRFWLDELLEMVVVGPSHSTRHDSLNGAPCCCSTLFILLYTQRSMNFCRLKIPLSCAVHLLAVRLFDCCCSLLVLSRGTVQSALLLTLWVSHSQCTVIVILF